MVNSAFYKEVLQCLREKTGEMAEWLDAASRQCALPDVTVHSPILMGKKTLVLSQPAYSPDLPLCDFWLFSKFKETMKGK
jgi:hypothetical protein